LFFANRIYSVQIRVIKTCITKIIEESM